MNLHDIAKINPHELLKKYERAIYYILIVLFAIIVAFSIFELINKLYDSLVIHTPLLLDNNELLGIFGYFLLVLIGVELLVVTAAYVNEKVIHVEVVIIIAIIAIVRGVILLDTSNADAMNMFATAAIILALCSGYYFLTKSGIEKR